MGKTKNNKEFVVLMAILMSLVALAIDAMLPALGQIQASFQIQNPNRVQLIISMLFLGMAAGILFFGPLSDSFGRKGAISLGIVIFIVGSLVSVFSQSLNVMLVGRVLQGFGAASCRVVTMSMVRDKFEGPRMGEIMSFIIIIFILVPAIAPSFGQIILLFADWRAIFVLFVALGILCLLWFHFRQEETLAAEKRLPFSLATILAGCRETLMNPLARGYTIASGFIYGALVGYLSSAQPLLQDQYELGKLFSVYFGVLALSIGLASYVNARLIRRFGMERLCSLSLMVLSVISFVFFVCSVAYQGEPPFFLFFSYLALSLFCLGILFGNFNTLALEPLGHIAGVANSVIGFVQTLLSVFFGGVIGQLYNGTVLPLVAGFFIFGVLSLGITLSTNKKSLASS